VSISARRLGLRNWDLFLNLGLGSPKRRPGRSHGQSAAAVLLGEGPFRVALQLALVYERRGMLADPSARRWIRCGLSRQPDALNSLVVIYASRETRSRVAGMGVSGARGAGLSAGAHNLALLGSQLVARGETAATKAR